MEKVTRIRKKLRQICKIEKMTEITLLILVLTFLIVCFFVVYLYDKKLVKSITEHEKRLEEKGILKRHFSKPLS